MLQPKLLAELRYVNQTFVRHVNEDNISEVIQREARMSSIFPSWVNKLWADKHICTPTVKVYLPVIWTDKFLLKVISHWSNEVEIFTDFAFIDIRQLDVMLYYKKFTK